MNEFSGGRGNVIEMSRGHAASDGKRADRNGVADLASRHAFIGFTEKDRDSIRSIKDIIDAELPKALDGFYQQVRKTSETRAFFPSEGAMDHAKQAQQDHWKSISSAQFDSAYAEKVNAIGKVHAKIGLEPRWYIGGYGVVMDRLIHAIIKDMPMKVGLLPPKKSQEEYAQNLGDVIGSLVKAVFLEMDLTISVYLDEAEKSRQKARDEAILKERQFVSTQFGSAINDIARGNLTSGVRGDLPQAYVTLRDDLNGAIESLRETLQVASDTINTIDTSASEIQDAVTEMKMRTESQATSVGRTAAAIEQITATVSSTSVSVSDANTFISNCRDITEKFSVMMQNSKDAMAGIARSSSAISEITEVMESIASQTNILALNAAVEAARAGESGRGFTVLAQEIRNLAGRAASASKEVRTLIADSNERVSAGVHTMEDAGKAMDSIISGVSEVSEHLKSIDTATNEQVAALRDVNNAISVIDQGTRQNTTMVERTSVAVVNMAEKSRDLRKLLSEFHLEQ